MMLVSDHAGDFHSYFVIIEWGCQADTLYRSIEFGLVAIHRADVYMDKIRGFERLSITQSVCALPMLTNEVFTNVVGA